MRTLTTRSTFRPPPFVSGSKAGTGFDLPTLPVRVSYHTPSPYTMPGSTGAGANDSFFLAAVTSDEAGHGGVVAGGGGEGEGLGRGGAWWNATSDVNLTTPSSSAVTSAAVTSSAALDPSAFPAGYPSGYTWFHIIFASVIVTLVMLIIVVGNLLVMWAIVTDKNLKGTQNYFIGSLALADFLLGLLIVPFSLANELMGYWYFGTVFCEVWKAVDVLLCTASINSLCLISLDRYWSITKALHYSRQRTAKRAAIMIFVVWFVSAAICIPPLIGWNQPAPDSDWPVCGLSEDIGYVLYSSMGSFYIPAFIMVFVYFKIYQAARARARKTVTKVPRGMTTGDKSEQKNSTESSGTDQVTQQHHQQLHHQQHQHSHQQQQEQQQLQQQQRGQVLDSPLAKHRDDDIVEDRLNNRLKIHPLQSSSIDEMKTDEAGIEEEEEEEEEEDQHHAALTTSECRCANEILDVYLTPALTSEDEGGSVVQRDRYLDFRSRSLSLPCRALRTDELAKLISTDSDSCDALVAAGGGGPALNFMDRGRFGFYSLPTTTTTDTDSSMDLSYNYHYHHHHQQQRHHQFFQQQQQQEQQVSFNNTTPSVSASNKSVRTISPVDDDGRIDTPLSMTESQTTPPGLQPQPPPAQTAQDNGNIQRFKIVEPKQNGNLESTGATSSSTLGTPDTKSMGLFSSIRRQLFSANNGKAGGGGGGGGEAKPLNAPKKKGHKKLGARGVGGVTEDPSSTTAAKSVDFFSADRHKRKLAKARERRATLVLGLVMAAFILCWLPFFLLYVVSAFCVGDCIPLMVFTVFFWIGYCNSALNPIIYTVFNRDFRRAFQRILFGRGRNYR